MMIRAIVSNVNVFSLFQAMFNRKAHFCVPCVYALACFIGCGQPNNTSAVTKAPETPPASRPLQELGSLAIAVDPLSAVQDPKNDGWESEALAEAAGQVLKKLAKAIENGINVKTIERLSGNGHFRELRPTKLEAVEANAAKQLSLFHPPSDWLPAESEAQPLARRLKAMIEPFNSTVEAHFKIISVELDATTATTRVLYDAKSTANERGMVMQQKATWICTWQRVASTTTAKEPSPTLLAVDVEDFEEARSGIGEWFSDRTLEVLGGDSAFTEHLALGLNHWMRSIERSQMMDDSVRTGLAIGDVNGDGLDDVYRCQGPGLPNRLLLHQPDGTVRDCSAESKTDWLDGSSAALILDFNNDGIQDLAVASRGGVLIMQNDGTGKYDLVSKLGPDGIDCQSLAAADYDNDGDLDLFVCAYRPATSGRNGDFVFHDAVTGGDNFLFRNDIEGTKWSWNDVTAEAGLSAGASRYSLAAAWEDYDNDGDQDLYVANDYGRNYLYRNDNGRFVDATVDAGLQDTGFGMSVDWGDYNQDGFLDLYVGNMFSSAGHRITSNPKFQPNSSSERKALYRRMAKGNSLFKNIDGRFTEVTDSAGVAMGRWAWSSVFSDINNDGMDDIVIANGYITSEDSSDL